MKHFITTIALFTGIMGSAFSAEIPGRIIPLKGADLKIEKATGSFEKIENARIVLMRKNVRKPVDGQTITNIAANIEPELDESFMPYRGPAGIIFEYDDANGEHRSVELEIKKDRDNPNRYKDECGSTIYHARLKGGDPMGARFDLTLVDHTTRFCHDYQANLWEVSVREGYGWCGTMDSTLKAAGNPEAILTIQNLN